MSDVPEKKNLSPDWFVRGALTRVGDIVDKFTGRKWQPSSGLATSELIERLKMLLDSEAIEKEGKIKFVPHNIQLKMQWDKFSTDAEKAINQLQTELLTAAVDHINDRRYHTFAPINLTIKPDYFTEGVKLLASFGEFADEPREAELNLSVPDLQNVVIEPKEIVVEPEKKSFVFSFVAGNIPREVKLNFAAGTRRSVGRSAENDLSINDPSVSKIHAALILNADDQLLVSDTGSTNGTFVGGERIAYGKAIVIGEDDSLKFGLVEINIKRENLSPESNPASEILNNEIVAAPPEIIIES